MEAIIKILKNNLWQNFLIACWAFLISIALLNNPFGRLEGFFFPVMSKISVSKIQPVDFGSIIIADYVKYRDCSFKEINWELKDDLTSSSLVSIIDNDIATKSNNHYTKKVFVNASDKEIVRIGSAHVKHTCHPFFHTITKIYGK